MNENTTPAGDAGAPASEGAGGPTYSPPTASQAPASGETPAPAPAPAPRPQTSWAPAPSAGERHRSHEIRRGGVLGGVILIILGLIFLANQFIPGIDLGRLWPLILIAIGIGVIFRRR